jgi:hypothetical protein
MKLTPNTYLCDIGDQTILNPEVILTPVAWIAERLAGKKDFDMVRKFFAAYLFIPLKHMILSSVFPAHQWR